VAGLVLYEPWVRGSWAPDYPWRETAEELERRKEALVRAWGTLELATSLVRTFAPSRADDQRYIEWLAEDHRLTGTPTEVALQAQMDFETDVRDILRSIHVPTLVLCRTGSRPDESRYVADGIDGSTYVALPGSDHISIAGDVDQWLAEVETFVDRLEQSEVNLDRVLATVMFTDIAGSTARAASIGDRAWADLVRRHHERIARLVAQFRGRAIDQAGDGTLAAFDGPARAIRCAVACVRSVQDLGFAIRAGIHTGECQRDDGRLRGLAVHIGARVMTQAAPGEVLVSQTVRDLVAGSGLVFEEAGEHELKGVPDRWRLFKVAGA